MKFFFIKGNAVSKNEFNTYFLKIIVHWLKRKRRLNDYFRTQQLDCTHPFRNHKRVGDIIYEDDFSLDDYCGIIDRSINYKFAEEKGILTSAEWYNLNCDLAKYLRNEIFGKRILYCY